MENTAVGDLDTISEDFQRKIIKSTMISIEKKMKRTNREGGRIT